MEMMKILRGWSIGEDNLPASSHQAGGLCTLPQLRGQSFSHGERSYRQSKSFAQSTGNCSAWESGKTFLKSHFTVLL